MADDDDEDVFSDSGEVGDVQIRSKKSMKRSSNNSRV
jgi:hypothetical protein